METVYPDDLRHAVVDHLYQLREVDYPDGQSLVTDYDANGNRVRHRHPMGDSTSDSFIYSGNRVTAGQTARKGVTTYRHDIQGNLSVESDYSTVSDTGDASKAWRVTARRFNRRNELERVVQIRRLGTTDTTLLGFVYGEDGNRIASLQGNVSGSDTTWTATHRWVYDGSVISADSGDGHGWRWHAYQGLSRIAEGEDTGNLRVRYVVTDHQGTTQLLTDDTGAVLGRWTWDPWGNIEEAWSQSSTDLLYQGKPYEVALGEWYFNARWYSPERGMFTGRDPAGQFYSPYEYVGNGPLMRKDPDGKVILYEGDASQIAFSKNLVHQIEGTTRGSEIINALQCSEVEFTMMQIESGVAGKSVGFSTPSALGEGGKIYYDPTTKIYAKTTEGLRPIEPVVQVAHEMGHASDWLGGFLNLNEYKSGYEGMIKIEIQNMHDNENPVRLELEIPARLESESGYRVYGF